MYNRDYRELRHLLWTELTLIWNNFGQTKSIIQSYLLQALNRKQNISYIAIANYGLIYHRKKDFVYKFARSEQLLDLYGECLQEEPMYIPCNFRNDKTYVTSLEELNFVRKNDLKNMQSECETLKLRKNNLLENIANQIRY